MMESARGQEFLRQVKDDTVRKALEELTAQGWTVFWDVGRNQLDWLPESLREFEHDYVARKDDSIIIGEVKSRRNQSWEALNRIASAVVKTPNVRLEVNWLGDIAATGAVAPLIEVDPAVVQSYIDVARDLLQLNYVSQAAFTAWSAVEGALMYYAARLDLPLRDDARFTQSPWQLLSYLDSLGYINDTDLKRLTELRNHRNAVAHYTGLEIPVTDEDVEYGLSIAEQMLSGRYVVADP
jgi:REase_AHJR-like